MNLKRKICVSAPLEEAIQIIAVDLRVEKIEAKRVVSSSLNTVGLSMKSLNKVVIEPKLKPNERLLVGNEFRIRIRTENYPARKLLRATTLRNIPLTKVRG